MWQDTRVDTLVAEYSKDGGQDRFRDQTGLPLASYFSGLKLQWLLDTVDGARAQAEAGDALFGNMDTWVLWNLTGGPDGGLHLTDVTNASRTQLMNLADAGLGRRDAGDVPHPARLPADASRRPRRSMARRSLNWPACRSPASSATSRRRWSARPASSRARRRTPTAPAASC